jgi:hypothetical protein
LFCFVISGVLMSSSVAAPKRNELTEMVSQGRTKVNLSVNDARPVAKAITMLGARYGWIITYEDPRYAHADDIADVTEKVRRDLGKYPEGQAPRVLIPKGGDLNFDYDVLAETNLPSDPGVVVRQLLNAQAATASSARFRLEKSKSIIHVIPSAIKDRSGRLTPQQSLLDTIVTLSANERTGLQTLEALTESIGKAAQVRIILGNVPLGLFLRHKDSHGVAGQRAREFLVELLRRISPDRPLSWQLLYDPGLQMYALNIYALWIRSGLTKELQTGVPALGQMEDKQHTLGSQVQNQRNKEWQEPCPDVILKVRLHSRNRVVMTKTGSG